MFLIDKIRDLVNRADRAWEGYKDNLNNKADEFHALAQEHSKKYENNEPMTKEDDERLWDADKGVFKALSPDWLERSTRSIHHYVRENAGLTGDIGKEVHELANAIRDRSGIKEELKDVGSAVVGLGKGLLPDPVENLARDAVGGLKDRITGGADAAMDGISNATHSAGHQAKKLIDKIF